MEESALQLLRKDLLGRSKTIGDIRRRNEELRAQESDLRAQWEAAGGSIRELWEDEAYQRIRAERQEVSAALQQHLDKPRLDKEQAAELRKRLTAEEKAQLRQELLQHLQSLPEENKAGLAATLEKAIERMVSVRGMSPEMEAAIAKARKLQERINQ